MSGSNIFRQGSPSPGNSLPAFPVNETPGDESAENSVDEQLNVEPTPQATWNYDVPNTGESPNYLYQKETESLNKDHKSFSPQGIPKPHIIPNVYFPKYQMYGSDELHYSHALSRGVHNTHPKINQPAYNMGLKTLNYHSGPAPFSLMISAKELPSMNEKIDEMNPGQEEYQERAPDSEDDATPRDHGQPPKNLYNAFSHSSGSIHSKRRNHKKKTPGLNGIQGQPVPTDNDDDCFEFICPSQLVRYNTLDRGTFFIPETRPNKDLYFIVQHYQDIMVWRDDYVVNSYLLPGLVLRVNTLTARIYVFIGEDTKIAQSHIMEVSPGEFIWTNLPNDGNTACIIGLDGMERVELFDNTQPGCEGVVCFMASNKSSISFNTDDKTVLSWNKFLRTRLLYEPSGIYSLSLSILPPIPPLTSPLFTTEKVAVVLDPRVNMPVTFKYPPQGTANSDVQVHGRICIEGIGQYSLTCPNGLVPMQSFAVQCNKATDIAQELGAVVLVLGIVKKSNCLSIDTPPLIRLCRRGANNN